MRIFPDNHRSLPARSGSEREKDGKRYCSVCSVQNYQPDQSKMHAHLMHVSCFLHIFIYLRHAFSVYISTYGVDG